MYCSHITDILFIYYSELTISLNEALGNTILYNYTFCLINGITGYFGASAIIFRSLKLKTNYKTKINIGPCDSKDSPPKWSFVVMSCYYFFIALLVNDRGIKIITCGQKLADG